MQYFSAVSNCCLLACTPAMPGPHMHDPSVLILAHRGYLSAKISVLMIIYSFLSIPGHFSYSYFIILLILNGLISWTWLELIHFTVMWMLTNSSSLKLPTVPQYCKVAYRHTSICVISVDNNYWVVWFYKIFAMLFYENVLHDIFIRHFNSRTQLQNTVTLRLNEIIFLCLTLCYCLLHFYAFITQ